MVENITSYSTKLYAVLALWRTRWRTRTASTGAKTALKAV